MANSFTDHVLESVGASSSLLYTTPTVESAKIIHMTCHNYSASNITLTINIVQSGGSVASSNEYFSEIIAAGETRSIYELIGSIFSTGDLVYAVASSASSVNLKMGVKEIT